jgi:allantoinase
LPYHPVPAQAVYDVGDLVVSPGIVDSHVHINEPGRTEWEGFETATRAAAAGGVTTIVDMPLNSIPVTTTKHALHTKLAAACGRVSVDCGFHAGLVPENAGSLASLLDAGVLGVKAFLISSGIPEFAPVGEHYLRMALPEVHRRGLPLLVHAELASNGEQRAASSRRYRDYLGARPRRWENDAVALLIRLAEEYRCRIHIVHVSSAEVVPLVEQAKERGLPISAETCPHYLCFAAEEIPDGATEFKCAPPIRERENNEALWDALKSGVLDCVVSDHSPSPPELKLQETGDFLNAWGGIASLQLSLAVMWTAARRRGFSLNNLSKWMCEQPARLLGLQSRKGAIAPGLDADLVVWNPDETFVVEPSLIHHRHKLTPYNGRKLFGKVYATFLRGERVYDGGTFLQGAGQILLCS